MSPKLIVIAVVALLAAPSAALAEPGKGQSQGQSQAQGKPETAGAKAAALPNGAQRCAALRISMTPPVFASTYGATENDHNAFGKCVSQANRSNAAARAAAASACKAEQADAGFADAHEGKTFAQFYGGSDDAANAFGKCVSQKAKAKTDAAAVAMVRGAKACKAALRADATGFRAQFRNFGKCVSSKTSS